MRHGVSRFAAAGWRPAGAARAARAALAAWATLAVLLLLPACSPAALPPGRGGAEPAPGAEQDGPPGRPIPANPGSLVPTQLVVPPALAQGTIARSRELHAPSGFQIQLYAAGVPGARFMAVGPGGDLYLSMSRAGRVVMLPDRDGDGMADQVVTVAEGLDLPHGLAWHEGALYVAENSRVIRLEYQDGALTPATGYTVVVGDLPRGGSHWSRSIAFGPHGRLYVAAGSSCNVCREDDPQRAAISRYNADGTGEEILATGLRNAVGLAFHPETGELWATENGRDRLGDNFPPDEINIVYPGRHYGWPHCHGNRVPDPEWGRGFDCGQTEPPAVALQAHSAPLGLAFYTGDAFPAPYRGQLFVAFHGSWNRSVPTGYKVVMVPVQAGRPAGGYTDFLTGFLGHDGAWGRPVDLVVGADGALYLSDDKAGAVYRITYIGT